MVRKSDKTETGVATRTSGKVNSWEADMARDAEIAAAQEVLTGGQFLGLESGVLSFNGAPMQNNELYCVILDSIFENVFYEGEFVRGNPAAPTCFAFGRFNPNTKSVEGIDTTDGVLEMAPHKSVLAPVCESCDKCPMNQFGSARTGKGKACKNTRRLALIPVLGTTKRGEFIVDTSNTEHYSTAPIAHAKTPVTSTKVYGAYVNQLSSSLKRPPYGVFTRMFLTPSDNQFTMNFESIDPIPASLGPIIRERHNEAMNGIAFPYAQHVEEEAPTKGRAAGKKAPAKGKPVPPPAKGKAAPAAKGGKRY